MGLKFDGVDIESTYSLMVDGASTWTKPARDVELVHVPGRNGDLLFDNGCWRNVEISYSMLIRKDWKTDFETFASWLVSHVGYFRLEDPERHPGVYRMAEFAGSIEPDLWFTTETGQFTITFNCKPQQWLLTGETAITGSYAPVLSARVVNDSGTYKTEQMPNDGTALMTARIPFEIGDPSSRLRAYTTADSIQGEPAELGWLFYYNIDQSYSGNITQATVPGYGSGQYIGVATSTYTEDGWLRFFVYIPQGLDKFTVVFTDSAGVEHTINTNILEVDISNPTNFISFPTITFDKVGALRLGSFTVSVGSGATFPVTIDTDLGEVYSVVGGEKVNMSQYVTVSCSDPKELRDFPYLVPGTNHVSVDIGEELTVDDLDYGDGTVTIVPNWYRI